MTTRMMQMPSNLRAENHTVDDSAKGPQKFASATLRERHIDALLAETYAEHIGATAANNPLLSSVMKYLTTAKPRSETLAGHTRRWRVIDFIIVLLLRLYYPQILHFLTLCLSLLAFRCRVPHTFWKLLSMFGVVYSWKLTGGLALELGQRCAPSGPGDVPDGAVAGIYCFDNNDIFRRANCQHADEGRRNDMLAMNNIYLYKDSYATEAELHIRDG